MTTDQQNYSCTITAAVTPMEAFDAINHVNEWWAKNTEGPSEKEGDVFTIRFGNTYVIFKMAEVIPGKKIVWEAVESYLPWLKDTTEWTGTSVVFDITQKENTTEVTMTHAGLTPDIECFDRCQSGWNRFIAGSLYKLLNERTGLPE